ncbi:cytochrome b5 domain-containing protein [Heliophilum fasciatum]|uniref:Putative heme/steroid binding protein n=1 Tax=Heliophilum fasciatum TaxID=35700 RepID=A0A4R2S8C7_9FIRM|nr:cytochrome b5 domain-containing protein [Heliophilum fasciatum]MCW2276868.1 putative heme/steroid binding protein/uncharacterized membrane protein [Heliophilum fasciatum]TCP68671.1 putative heme/steroid binding protein [Heliophilum fasciatum]
MSTDLPVISPEQLAAADGKEGRKAYVVYNGLVYDVTESAKWRGGKHFKHWAGGDLTGDMEKAPHAADVMERFPVIGRWAGGELPAPATSRSTPVPHVPSEKPLSPDVHKKMEAIVPDVPQDDRPLPDRLMTVEELREYNGEHGQPAYVGYRGRVYDVTVSRMWQKGHHFAHAAGRDLTRHLEYAPHDPEYLFGFPLVARLERVKENPTEQVLNFIMRFHPHPASVHFPIALSIVCFGFYFPAAILQSMGISKGFLGIPALGWEAFYLAGFLSLIATAISGPFAFATGFLSWTVNFAKKINPMVKFKVITSFLFMIFSWALLLSQILGVMAWNGFLFQGLLFALVVMTSLVAYQGGRLSWG